ncbi:MAG: hypothetical protein ACRDP3_05675 [Streptomyces sp.]|uniref:hypothetical protein n=1 Tax=Streptomyces sp. TaxID=1931 RepID=UPI003D6B3FB8
MSANVIHSGTLIGCPHGGRATAVMPASASAGVRVDGLPVGSATHVHTVTACPHTVNGVPTPCTSVRWTPGSDGVLVDGTPVLLDITAAQCFSAALMPQGPPLVSAAPQGVVCR